MKKHFISKTLTASLIILASVNFAYATTKTEQYTYIAFPGDCTGGDHLNTGNESSGLLTGKNVTKENLAQRCNSTDKCKGFSINKKEKVYYLKSEVTCTDYKDNIKTLVDGKNNYTTKNGFIFHLKQKL